MVVSGMRLVHFVKKKLFSASTCQEIIKLCTEKPPFDVPPE